MFNFIKSLFNKPTDTFDHEMPLYLKNRDEMESRSKKFHQVNKTCVFYLKGRTLSAKEWMEAKNIIWEGEKCNTDLICHDGSFPLGLTHPFEHTPCHQKDHYGGKLPHFSNSRKRIYNTCASA